MLNNIVIVGNLGVDPEVFYTPEGGSRSQFQPGVSCIQAKHRLDQGHLF
jgi:single-stranded DNA-binding protein